MAVRHTAAAVLVLVVAAAELVGNAVAATHVVRDNMGWGIPRGGSSDYANWASRQNFRVGDTIVFNFTTGFHDVALVTRPNFDRCSSTGPITLITIGPATITLNSTGDHYYICTFGNHCSMGQKLAINVTSSSATPTPALTPTPTPSPSPSRVPPSVPSPSPSGVAPSVPTPTPTSSPIPSTTPTSSPGQSPSGTPLPGSSPAPGGGSATPSPGGTPALLPPSIPGGGGGVTSPPPSSSAPITTAASTAFTVVVSIVCSLIMVK